MKDDRIKPLDAYETSSTNYKLHESHYGLNTSNLINVDINRLFANENQTRLEYDDLSEIIDSEDINSLAKSIKNYGLQQPIGIKELPFKDGRGVGYQVIFGHRRVLAYKILFQEEKNRLEQEGKNNSENKYRTIKAFLYPEEDMNDFIPDGFSKIDKTLILNVIENLDRKDLSIIEKAIIYENLQEKVTKEEINKRIAKELETAQTDKAKNKIKRNNTIALDVVAELLGVEPLEVYRSVRIKNSLDKTIIKEILEAREKNIKKRLDVNVLTKLATLRGFSKQKEIWKLFQDEKIKISRNEILSIIDEEKEKLGLSGKISRFKQEKEKEFNDGIVVVSDKQGIKIRSSEITKLDREDEKLLQKEISKIVRTFLDRTIKRTIRDKKRQIANLNNNNSDFADDSDEELI